MSLYRSNTIGPGDTGGHLLAVCLERWGNGGQEPASPSMAARSKASGRRRTFRRLTLPFHKDMAVPSASKSEMKLPNLRNSALRVP
ncbi:MAG: hypothetical protein ACPIOQ_52240 [Promethearchaeia archaeon]